MQMQDIVPEGRDPNQPKPDAPARARANPPHTTDEDKFRVFISYSRDDREFADQLRAALETCGFACKFDTEDISTGEDWKRRLNALIAEADSVIFVLSRASARSEICEWEVEESARLGKRILPVVGKSFGGASLPPRLQPLQRVFFYAEPDVEGSGFGVGLKRLVSDLNADYEWLRQHTRYLQRATEWDQRGRPTTYGLLYGEDEIAEANGWIARRPKTAPEPTDLQREFIRVSERAAEARLSVERQRSADLEKALRNADAILASATRIIFSVQHQMDDSTRQEVFALFQAGAEHGAAYAMGGLGTTYARGWGVAQDYAKAREWYEKAADSGEPTAMAGLGWLYEGGRGVAQDSAKALEWYEKAADKGDATAMRNLGVLYAKGQGVTQDYVKAREWYEKAAAKGDADATEQLESLAISEAAAAGRYGEALRLQAGLAAKTEPREIEREGKPGEETVGALISVAWCALFAREFETALTAVDRAHALLPGNLLVETNRAHALMFLEREEKARLLYLAHKGEALSPTDSRLWERVIAEDLRDLRKAGLTHPMMGEIEKQLGVSC
jgi:TPR repeat protein